MSVPWYNWPVSIPPAPTPPTPPPFPPAPPAEPPAVVALPPPPSAPRKDLKTRIMLDDGSAVELRVLDGLLVDDVLIQGAKAEGYRVMTGRDVFPTTTRDIKDYLIRIGFVTE